jgi:hypothetical protein
MRSWIGIASFWFSPNEPFGMRLKEVELKKAELRVGCWRMDWEVGFGLERWLLLLLLSLVQGVGEMSSSPDWKWQDFSGEFTNVHYE